MDVIWVAWCDDAGYAAVRREMQARDASARVLRVRDVAGAENAVRMLEGMQDEVGVVLAFAHPEALERAVCEAAVLDGVGAVVAIVSELDAGHVARLFRDGAQEVIAGERSASLAVGDGDRRPHGEVDRQRGQQLALACDDEAGSGTSHAAGGPGVRAVDAVRERASWEPVVLDGYADDLDEPDGMSAVRATGKPPGCGNTEGGTGSAPARDAAKGNVPGLAARFGRGASAGAMAAGDAGPRAPVVAAVSARGGSGVTTVTASMALVAARAGLRTAVLDLDLMFGNMAMMLGAEQAEDLAMLVTPARAGTLCEEDVVRASTRVAPGLTLWGPVRAPEQAELVGDAVELLLGVLRREADVIFVDTSTFWSDASAAAIAACDRCLVVGGAGAAADAVRVIDLAARIGVPRTRMTSVFNRMAAHEDGEDAATRFEFVCGLSSKERIADGGRELGGLVEIGHLSDHLGQAGAFQESVHAMTARVLAELGCRIDDQPAAPPRDARTAPARRLRLPWKKLEGDAA